MKPLALLAGLLVLIGSPALAQSLTVKGPTGQTLTLSAADLAALPRVKITFSAHGETHVYEGPLLIDILAKAGAPTGKALSGGPWPMWCWSPPPTATGLPWAWPRPTPAPAPTASSWPTRSTASPWTPSPGPTG